MKKIVLSCILFLFIIGCKTTKQSETNEKIVVSYKIFELKKSDKPLKYDPSILDFELIYDKNESIFQLIDKLDNNSNTIDTKITKGIYDGHIKFYKNNSEKQKFLNVDEKGQIFNVKTDFENYKWEINPNDTKEISGFKCYKATAKTERKHIWKNRSINTMPTLNRYVLLCFHPEHRLQRIFTWLVQLCVAQSAAPGLQFMVSAPV
jgi:GLPGLI family protein